MLQVIGMAAGLILLLVVWGIVDHRMRRRRSLSEVLLTPKPPVEPPSTLWEER